MIEKATLVVSSTPDIDLSKEQEAGFAEPLFFAIIFVGSLYYLYGKYFRKKSTKDGASGGCSGCSQKGGCPVSTVKSKVVRDDE